MQAYASRTGTKRNLAALRRAGWRILVSAAGVWRSEGMPYAVDNGAWTAHQQGRDFDVGAFEGVVGQLGADAAWVVAPDIVCGGAASLAMTRRWLPWLLDRTPRALVAVQDGMTPADVAPLLSARVGVAIGGSTEWKETQLARRVWRASWLHVLRVNTARRIALCAHAGADSFDGTSVTRFAVTLPRLDMARRQPSLWGAHV